MNRTRLMLLILLLSLLPINIPAIAQSPNVGLLHVVRLQSPRQVPPGSVFTVKIDIEYAVRQNATIRAAIFRGVDQSEMIWQSDSLFVSGGGDKSWTINLTAPPTDGALQLSAYAYYRDGNQWLYLNDTTQGSSYKQITIRVSLNANLQIQLNAPEIQLTIGNLTERTSKSGDVTITLPIDRTYPISVPPIVQLQNSTRLVFGRWNDGSNQTRKVITLDGDIKLAGSYKTQYLLTLSSAVSDYSYARWYDADSKVTLQSKPTVQPGWPLEHLGLKYMFQGWSGDVASASPTINFTMNKPKTVNANFSIDLTPLILPTIISVGIAGGIILYIMKRKGARKSNSPDSEVAEPKVKCKNCGEPSEEGWTHCIRCGTKLTPETIDK